jgi:hypothetical protein
MPVTIATDAYHVRTTVSPQVQEELLQEQADRQKKGIRVNLMVIAGEFLEEIAKQKREKRG